MAFKIPLSADAVRIARSSTPGPDVLAYVWFHPNPSLRSSSMPSHTLCEMACDKLFHFRVGQKEKFSSWLRLLNLSSVIWHCFRQQVWGVMTFYYLWGNGPDFLLAFPIFLLILMPFRHILRNIFGPLPLYSATAIDQRGDNFIRCFQRAVTLCCVVFCQRKFLFCFE